MGRTQLNMNRGRKSILLLAVIVICFASVPQVGAEEVEEFIPTNEWQEVKPGQAIPPGLHVRMDLSKGGKWAKLLEEEVDPAENAMVAVIPDEAVEAVEAEDGAVASDEGTDALVQEASDDSKTNEQGSGVIDGLGAAAKESIAALGDEFPYEGVEGKENVTMMYSVLSSLPPADGIQLPDPNVLSEEEFEAELQRTWDARQADLAAAMDAIENDFTVMKGLLQDLTAAMDERVAAADSGDAARVEEAEARALNVLSTLEYHVGDIDKAKDFYLLDGVQQLAPLLDAGRALAATPEAAAAAAAALPASSPALVSAAAWTLGTALQYNGEAQAAAVAAGVLPALLGGARQPALGAGCRQKVLYALGALVRDQADTQALFLASGGVDVLRQLLEEDAAQQQQQQQAEPVKGAAPFGVQKKVLALAADLLEWQPADPVVARRVPLAPGMDGVLPLSSRSTEAAAAAAGADEQQQQQQQQQADAAAASEDPYMVLDGGALRDALLRSPRWCRLVADALGTPDIGSQEKALLLLLRLSTSSPDTCRPILAADAELERTLQGLTSQWAQPDGAVNAERAEELRGLVAKVRESVQSVPTPVEQK